MGQYSLSGLAMLSGLGEAINLSGSDLMPAGSQVVTQFTSDNVVSDWSASRVRTALLAKGLDYKSWNRSGTGPARHTVKVALEQPMYTSQVQARIAEVFQAQGGRGARAFSSNSPYGTRPTSGPHAGDSGGTSSGGGLPSGGIATSDACRARGGVCRDINAMPIRGNEQIVRGLCAGASNIVCVVPRSSSSGGGGGGGGGSPAPDTGGAPAFAPGIPGQMDWGSWVLVGGSVLFLGAVVFAMVKKRRAQRAQMAVANGRRRNSSGAYRVTGPRKVKDGWVIRFWEPMATKSTEWFYATKGEAEEAKKMVMSWAAPSSWQLRPRNR